MVDSMTDYSAETIKRNFKRNIKNIKSYINKMDPKDKRYYAALFGAAAAVFILTNVFVLLSYIPTESMEPTIKAKSFTIANRLCKEIEQKDIVYFESESEGKTLVKRVIATGNQKVILKDNKVYVDGELFEEDYLKEEATYEPLEMFIPEGYLFLMGDNRNNSKDSRYIGCISEDDVIAVKKYKD